MVEVSGLKKFVDSLPHKHAARVWLSDTHYIMLRYTPVYRDQGALQGLQRHIVSHPVAYSDPEAYDALKAFIAAHWGHAATDSMFQVKPFFDAYRASWGSKGV